jgi:hypothetical protein
MSIDMEKCTRNMRRRSELRRARRLHVVAAVVAISFAVVAATWWLQPRYRATARLELDGRTFPVEAGSTAQSQVDEFLQNMHDKVASASPQLDESGFAVVDVASSNADSEDLRLVSAVFDLYADSADMRTSDRAVEALAGEYIEALQATVVAPPVSATELEAARVDFAEAKAERERAELMLASFERDNSAVLPGLEDARAQAVEESRRERAAIEQQLNALEARRNELDRGLAEMQRGASQFSSASVSELTSGIFTAAQARWAVLRGLHGDDYAPAIELGAALSEAKAAADARFASVSAELEEVRAAFERVQASQPLDHPDVIGLAHRVSALERLYERTGVTGLSNRDLRYIEGLAIERRDIDFEIAGAREQRAVLDARQGEQAQLAEQAPILAERHLHLQAELADAQHRHESAEAHYATLQDALQAASHERPGELSVASAVEVRRLTVNRPVIAAGLIWLLCLPIFLLTLRLIERRHRTVSGSNIIMRIQGRPPLAVIPELGGG